jgi:hypothetical protein
MWRSLGAVRSIAGIKRQSSRPKLLLDSHSSCTKVVKCAKSDVLWHSTFLELAHDYDGLVSYERIDAQISAGLMSFPHSSSGRLSSSHCLHTKFTPPLFTSSVVLAQTPQHGHASLFSIVPCSAQASAVSRTATSSSWGGQKHYDR